MTISRRKLSLAAASLFAVLAFGGAVTAPAQFGALAQSTEEAALAARVAELAKAMLAGDKAKLEDLSANELSYGHSAGKLETKAEFVTALAEKKSVFKSLELSDHKNAITGNTAIVRHTLTGESIAADGKINPVKIGIMQVWLKQDGKWKLYARQAFRI